MSKRKMRTLFWAVAAVLAIVPFMQGCSSTTNSTTSSDSSNSSASTTDASSETQTYEATRYGEVKSIDGSSVTVILGDLNESNNGPQASTGEGDATVPNVEGFAAGTDQITFDTALIEVLDSSGGAIEANSLMPGDILIMYGTVEGTAFVPQKIQIIDAAA